LLLFSHASPFSGFNFHYGLNGNEAAFISTIASFFVNGVQFLFVIAEYVLRSLGLYSIAKKRGFAAPGLAWVPFANKYILGKIADTISATNGKRTHKRFLILSFEIAAYVLGIVFLILFILTFEFPFARYGRIVGNMDDARIGLFILMLVIFGLLIVGAAITARVFQILAEYVILKDYFLEASAGL
jgi:hypothetical protein